MVGQYSIDFRLPVKLASSCPACACCGEPWCEIHQEHYADCPCPGPMSDPADNEGLDGEEDD